MTLRIDWRVLVLVLAVLLLWLASDRPTAPVTRREWTPATIAGRKGAYGQRTG
jgi:hypothetical protein